MKRMLTIIMTLVLFAGVATQAVAAIGWAGNVYPNSGTLVTPVNPVQVYAQVWKGGITDLPGQGVGITAELHYWTDIAGPTIVPMNYLGEVGSNDEFTEFIPQAALVGASWVQLTVIFFDAEDASSFEVLGDQNNNPPPFQYDITDVLPNDVDVTFELCMSGVETIGVPCVIGSAAEIGNWGTGVDMTQTGPELYEVTVTFLAGGNPAFEYKYRKDACVNWEGAPNRLVTLPTDGTTAVALATDSWDNLPIGCGQGTTLDEDKIICFQLCMEGVDNSGQVCVIGNQSQIGNWGSGVVMSHLGASLYQACVTFPAGSPQPIPVEYKFQKDNCGSWEGTPNRLLTIDNSLAGETAVTSTWEDGPGQCAPVATDTESWGAVKARYED